MNFGVVISHPTGNANVREAALALAEAGLLEAFHTSLAFFSPSWPRQLLRRAYPSELRPFTRCHPFRETLRLAATRLGIGEWVRHEKGWASVDAVYRSLDRKVSRMARARAVYCYEDGALETFCTAERLGAPRIYDLPIGYWRAARRILLEEAERRPEWLATMPGLQDSEEKLARKDGELRLASEIVVASTFTKSTLAECPYPIASVSVIPYGTDHPADEPPLRDSSGPLRALYVGALSQRKGIADLFDAIKMVGNQVDLTIVGRKTGGACSALDHALSIHRWIPSLPREKILEEMRRHDVLVFPSLFEGFGLVVTEALSQGLPVITTSHTCGPDVLTDGREGYLVPVRDPNAIADRLESLAGNRSLLSDMSAAALEKARELSWSGYRNRLAGMVRRVLAENPPP